MQNPTIPPDANIGQVSLNVSDLNRSLQFYTESLGLTVFSQDKASARLGAGKKEFLSLTEHPGARPYARTTGMYHMAILVPSRLELARVIQHLAETNTPLGGAADHLVSEALYLADPDDNGIEIYRDRPRSEWKYSNGAVEMATEPLDLDGVFGELKGRRTEWHGIAPDTRIGHIHLKVANIPDAVAFYRDLLGFQLMARFGPSAAFLSAGGYHHHIGMNTWESLGAPPPPSDAVGMQYFTVRLGDDLALEELRTRLVNAGVPLEAGSEGYRVRDPAGNGVLLAAE